MAITRVQSATATTASATSLAITFGANLTIGNLVVFAFAVGSGTSGVDSINTASTPDVPIVWLGKRNSGGANTAFLCLGRVNTALTSVTFTFGTTTSGSIIGAEYSGVSLIGLDQANFNTGSSTAVTSGSVTTTIANELIVSCMTVRGTSISAGAFSLPTPTGPPATAIVDQITSGVATSNADRAVALLERIVSSTTTQTTGCTSAVNNSWIGITATIRNTVTSGGGLKLAGTGGLA